MVWISVIIGMFDGFEWFGRKIKVSIEKEEVVEKDSSNIHQISTTQNYSTSLHSGFSSSPYSVAESKHQDKTPSLHPSSTLVEEEISNEFNQMQVSNHENDSIPMNTVPIPVPKSSNW